MVERIDLDTIQVEVGDSTKEFKTADCSIIVKSEDFELNDLVQMKPEDSALYFNGVVQGINKDGTLDILIEGDDLEDVEMNVNRCVNKTRCTILLKEQANQCLRCIFKTDLFYHQTFIE